MMMMMMMMDGLDWMPNASIHPTSMNGMEWNASLLLVSSLSHYSPPPYVFECDSDIAHAHANRAH